MAGSRVLAPLLALLFGATRGLADPNPAFLVKDVNPGGGDGFSAPTFSDFAFLPPAFTEVNVRSTSPLPMAFTASSCG